MHYWIIFFFLARCAFCAVPQNIFVDPSGNVFVDPSSNLFVHATTYPFTNCSMYLKMVRTNQMDGGVLYDDSFVRTNPATTPILAQRPMPTNRIDGTQITGGAMYFDGADDNINLDQMMDEAKTNDSSCWSFWVWFQGTNNTAMELICTDRFADAPNTRVRLYADARSTQMRWGAAANTNTITAWLWLTAKNTLRPYTNRPVLIHFQHNSLSNSFFVDGQRLNGTYAVTTDLSVWFDDVLNYPTNPADTIRLGIRPDDGVLYNPLEGYMSKVFYYNRWLTDTEILNDFKYKKWKLGL